jgi:hypothetical protein
MTQGYQPPRWKMRIWAQSASTLNTINIEYMRASCEYHTVYGATATRTAATAPVRRS